MRLLSEEFKFLIGTHREMMTFNSVGGERGRSQEYGETRSIIKQCIAKSLVSLFFFVVGFFAVGIYVHARVRSVRENSGQNASF